MLRYVLDFFVPLIFFKLSLSKGSKFFKVDVESSEKLSSIRLVGEYHSESLAVCSAIGSSGYFGFNAKEKKCRVHTGCPTAMTVDRAGWMYYISTNPDPG